MAKSKLGISSFDIDVDVAKVENYFENKILKIYLGSSIHIVTEQLKR